MATFTCVACGREKEDAERTDLNEHDTGSETDICLACHREIIASDSDLECGGCHD
jgi:hypothetical protein